MPLENGPGADAKLNRMAVGRTGVAPRREHARGAGDGRHGAQV
jgi:hypothetical protein